MSSPTPSGISLIQQKCSNPVCRVLTYVGDMACPACTPAPVTLAAEQSVEDGSS